MLLWYGSRKPLPAVSPITANDPRVDSQAGRDGCHGHNDERGNDRQSQHQIQAEAQQREPDIPLKPGATTPDNQRSRPADANTPLMLVKTPNKSRKLQLTPRRVWVVSTLKHSTAIQIGLTPWSVEVNIPANRSTATLLCLWLTAIDRVVVNLPG